jgi:hypothetical protein
VGARLKIPPTSKKYGEFGCQNLSQKKVLENVNKFNKIKERDELINSQ